MTFDIFEPHPDYLLAVLTAGVNPLGKVQMGFTHTGPTGHQQGFHIF